MSVIASPEHFMQRNRASGIAVCATCVGVALGAALAGCATNGLSSDLPPGEHLAGDWKVDSALSDDLGKAVEALRQQGRKARRHADETAAAPANGGAQGPPGRGRRRGGQQTEGTGEGETASGPEAVGPGVGPMPHVSPVDELMSNLPSGDYLKIGVSAAAFTVISGDSSDQYTPGQLSDISAEQGDAQQISGWKGTAYVIDTKPQLGPEIIQSYDLTKEGRLIMTLRLSGGGTKFTFTRIYDRTTGVTPLAPPTLN